jgi:lincosamide nucleotidyltransferase A/C/D/E
MDPEAATVGESGPEMTAADVLAFLDLVSGLGVRIWLDGGWAVDACLGRQTRRHGDLDIVIEERHLARTVAALEERGFGPVPRGDTRPWNFVLGDETGHEIDFHVIVIDAAGRGRYGPPEIGDFFYEAEALGWAGSIEGRPVACMPPDWLVRWHTGYELDADDLADVSALCGQFGIPLPDEYVALGESVTGSPDA